MSSEKIVSIVVPMFQEEDNIRLLYEAVCAEFEALSEDVEFIFVDDGSTDRTFEITRQLCHKHQQYIVQR